MFRLQMQCSIGRREFKQAVSDTRAVWPQAPGEDHGLIFSIEKQSKLAHVLLTASLAQLFPVRELGTGINVQHCSTDQTYRQ